MPMLNLFSPSGPSVILNPFKPREHNMDSRFLRVKSTPRTFLTDEDAPLLKLLRSMFIDAEAEYNVKELAPELGVEVFTVYKMFSAQTRLPAETLLAIMEFVHSKDPSDTRLIDFVCEPCGFMPMPKLVGVDRKKVREILMTAHDLTKENPE